MSKEDLTRCSEIISWLQASSFPVKHTSPDPDITDLLPLKNMIGAAHIVALGEATHGIHEFFTLKHRIFAFLVEELHFTSLVIEAGWDEVQRIETYLQGGEGEPEKLVESLASWIWNTGEFIDMVTWMRAYNEKSLEKLHLYGCDVQSPGEAMNTVLAYLSLVDKVVHEKVAYLYSEFRTYESKLQVYGQQPLAKRLLCRKNLQEVYNLLLSNQDAYESKTSNQDFLRVLHSARVVIQAEDVFSSKEISIRDCYMAQNIALFMNQSAEKTKMVLWAHNCHVQVSDQPETVGMASTYSYRSMGSYLREWYQKDIRIIGLCMYQGTTHTIYTKSPVSGIFGSLITPVLPPPPQESYEYVLSYVDYPQMIVDFSAHGENEAVKKWLQGPYLLRAIGGAYAATEPEKYFFPVQLGSAFDILLFLKNATPSRLRFFLDKQSLNRKEHSLVYSPQNLDFSNGTANWTLAGRSVQAYAFTIDWQEGRSPAYLGSETASPEDFVSLTQAIQLDNYRGKFLCFTASIYSSQLEGRAFLWMSVNQGKRTVALAKTLLEKGIRKEYSVTLTIPQEGTTLAFGLRLEGKGALRIMSLNLK